ncbi:MAG: hypothetical protein WBX02_11635 [Terriglobales bacterium]
MEGDYKMFRTAAGKTAFAIVGVAAREGEGIRWHPSLTGMRRLYGGPVQAGVEHALHEHAERGGAAHSIEIIKLIESTSDTKEDAVKCAATLATWKALGHPESEAEVVFQGDAWEVSFPPL